jgi:hypothetical protein
MRGTAAQEQRRDANSPAALLHDIVLQRSETCGDVGTTPERRVIPRPGSVCRTLHRPSEHVPSPYVCAPAYLAARAFRFIPRSLTPGLTRA